MQIELTKSYWADIDNFGSSRHTRVFEVCGWDESLLGPSPQVRHICDVLPFEGDERYYTWECPPTWSMI